MSAARVALPDAKWAGAYQLRCWADSDAQGPRLLQALPMEQAAQGPVKGSFRSR